MKGFLVEADAIAPCKVCGAAEGVPCRPARADRGKPKLKPGFVHIARRIDRLRMTASAPEKREAFEREALVLLRQHLREQRAARR